MKGGGHSVIRRSSRASSRASSRPNSGIIVSRASSRASSIRPSVSGISKVSCCDNVNLRKRRKIIDSINNFNLKDFYDNLLEIPLNKLPYTIESMKLGYTAETTLEPSRAYLNMKGLKFVNYLYGKYQHATSNEEKNKIKSIISLFDQYGMSHGIRNSDLPIVEGQVDKRYFACYKDLYEEIYKKLFPRGNNDYYPVSLSAIPLYCKPRLQTVREDDYESL
jgi:hypothetical protein